MSSVNAIIPTVACWARKVHDPPPFVGFVALGDHPEADELERDGRRAERTEYTAMLARVYGIWTQCQDVH